MLVGLGTSLQVFSDQEREYEITVTNLTRGQSFTPILAVTHADGANLFSALNESRGSGSFGLETKLEIETKKEG